MIRRFRCKNCHSYHNELPGCLTPYKHYETEVIGNDAYLTVKEAALLAGINPATVHKWIKKGKIEAVQSSKTVRIPRQAFENWLQSRKKEDQHGINC